MKTHNFADAEDIFADADSIDAVPRRAGMAYLNVDADSIESNSRQPGFMNAIQISDDEMDAVCAVVLFSFVKTTENILFNLPCDLSFSFQIRLKHRPNRLMVIIHFQHFPLTTQHGHLDGMQPHHHHPWFVYH